MDYTYRPSLTRWSCNPLTIHHPRRCGCGCGVWVSCVRTYLRIPIKNFKGPFVCSRFSRSSHVGALPLRPLALRFRSRYNTPSRFIYIIPAPTSRGLSTSSRPDGGLQVHRLLPAAHRVSSSIRTARRGVARRRRSAGVIKRHHASHQLASRATWCEAAPRRPRAIRRPAWHVGTIRPASVGTPPALLG